MWKSVLVLIHFSTFFSHKPVGTVWITFIRFFAVDKCGQKFSLSTTLSAWLSLRKNLCIIGSGALIHRIHTPYYYYY